MFTSSSVVAAGLQIIPKPSSSFQSLCRTIRFSVASMYFINSSFRPMNEPALAQTFGCSPVSSTSSPAALPISPNVKLISFLNSISSSMPKYFLISGHNCVSPPKIKSASACSNRFSNSSGPHCNKTSVASAFTIIGFPGIECNAAFSPIILSANP